MEKYIKIKSSFKTGCKGCAYYNKHTVSCDKPSIDPCVIDGKSYIFKKSLKNILNKL